jgi:hypothetical protein
MADVNADSCCVPEQQATCCEPSAKADCCGHEESCGCDANCVLNLSADKPKVLREATAGSL